jgi:hypothetical protein
MPAVAGDFESPERGEIVPHRGEDFRRSLVLQARNSVHCREVVVTVFEPASPAWIAPFAPTTIGPRWGRESTDELVSTPKAPLADEVFCDCVVADRVDALRGAACSRRIDSGRCRQFSHRFTG